MEPGTQVWCPVATDEAWAQGTVVGNDADGKVHVKIAADGDDEPRAFTADALRHRNIYATPDAATNCVEDLVNLPFLHEPSILHALHQRWPVMILQRTFVD